MNQSSNFNKRQTRREQMRQREARGRNIFMAVIIAVAAFIAFLVIYPNVKPITNVVAVSSPERTQTDANHMGDPNAPVQLVEFADYQCPYCERFFKDTEPLLEKTYVETGKVYFTYRSAGNWVSLNMRGGKTESADAAQAAYCAGDQNLYWTMHDMLYENVIGEDAGSFVDRRLIAIAEKTPGLDLAQFTECYNSNKYKSQIEQDYQDAVDAGVNGTPSFMLTYTDASGKQVPFVYTDPQGKTLQGLIEGAYPFDFFQEKIEAALAAAGK
ncbi:MAG: thioredoxin domain-containing protein [Anaerolineales bacterium]|nr:thioredoxin domain-containing protein [Anaerolineales bacterium]